MKNLGTPKGAILSAGAGGGEYYDGRSKGKRKRNTWQCFAQVQKVMRKKRRLIWIEKEAALWEAERQTQEKIWSGKKT